METHSRDKKIVESFVRNSFELQLIIDLSNEDKHSFPLQNRKSKKDPLISNIRNENRVPSGIGWINILEHGRVDVEADVIDASGNFIISFRELVKKALIKWEDFIIEYIPEKATQIKEHREKLKKHKEEYEKKKIFIDKVNSIYEKGSWLDLRGYQLKKGMIVRFQNKINPSPFSNMIKSIIVGFEMNVPIKTKVIMKSDLSHLHLTYIMDDYNWQFLLGEEEIGYTIVLEYFKKINQMREFSLLRNDYFD